MNQNFDEKMRRRSKLIKAHLIQSPSILQKDVLDVIKLQKEMKYVRKSVDIEVEKKMINYSYNKYSKKSHSYERLLISFKSPCKFRWDLFVMVLAVYNSVEVPLTLSFQLKNVILRIISEITDYIFFVDIIVNFFTSFMDSKGHEEWNLKKIAINYMA